MRQKPNNDAEGILTSFIIANKNTSKDSKGKFE